MVDDLDVDAFLEHYGVKGMRWGVRKDSRAPGVSAKTNRVARKDAKEFSKAKMFYGDGAGTRRKLIKATVEARSKKDPSYKKAFDYHLDRQDLSKRASQARGERKRKDVKAGVAKNARGAINIARGNSRYAPALLVGAVAVGGAAYRSGVAQQVAQQISKSGKKTIREARIYAQSKRGQSAEEWMRSNGWG